MQRMRQAAVCTLATMLACTAGDGDDGFFTSTPDPTSGPDDTATSAAGTSDDGALDDGFEGTTMGGPGIRCGKVDLLFVYEPSEAENTGDAPEIPMLQEAFDTLVSGLYGQVGVDDFRVMFTRSRAIHLQGACSGEACEELDNPDACDGVFAAGYNGAPLPGGPEMPGEDGIGGDCMSGRWFASGEVDLADAFTCVSYPQLNHVYEGPDALLDALAQSIEPASAGGTCNAGFLRDDALLVVVLVGPQRNAVPDTSSTTVDALVDQLVAAKHGAMQNVVVLGLVSDSDLEAPLCAGTPTDGLPAQVRELVDAFPHGKVGSVCQPDYLPFMGVVIDEIDAGCEEFVPVG
jgi:hypothetical protein